MLQNNVKRAEWNFFSTPKEKEEDLKEKPRPKQLDWRIIDKKFWAVFEMAAKSGSEW